MNYKVTRTSAVSGGQVWVGWSINYKDGNGRWHTFILLGDTASTAPPNAEAVETAIATYEEWRQ